MQTIITFTLYATVQDAAELIEAAREHLRREGNDEDNIADMVPDGDVAAALQMLLDPGSVAGCDVLDSAAEITHDTARTIPASAPGAALRSEDCSVSFEQEG